MKPLSSLQAVTLARSELEAAEHALAAALSRIDAAPRAAKVAISEVLEQALDRLQSARRALQSFDEPAQQESLQTQGDRNAERAR
jgi:hypothetical protein